MYMLLYTQISKGKHKHNEEGRRCYKKKSHTETLDLKYTIFKMKFLLQNWSVESQCAYIIINQKVCEVTGNIIFTWMMGTLD